MARKAMRYDAALAKKRESRRVSTQAKLPSTGGRTPPGSALQADLDAAAAAYRKQQTPESFARYTQAKRAMEAASNRRRA